MTYATEAEAQTAVSQLDKKEVEGRTINVELAKPGSGPRPPRERKAREPKPRKTDEELVNGDGDVVELGENGEVKAKKKRAKKPKAKKPKAEGDDAVAEAADALAATDLSATNPDDTAAAKKPRAPRTKKPKSADATPGLRRGPPTGEPSKTLLFVANLAFAVDDAALKEVFAAYAVTSARVVTKKVGPSEGRSKGFGFVEFANEEEQQKALNEIQGKEVEGRALQLKVAINPAEKADEPAAEAAAEASA